jgi:hypothetical protein
MLTDLQHKICRWTIRISRASGNHSTTFCMYTEMKYMYWPLFLSLHDCFNIIAVKFAADKKCFGARRNSCPYVWFWYLYISITSLSLRSQQTIESRVDLSATGYGLDGRGLNPGRSNIFLFSKASKPILRPSQPPIQWVPGSISPEVKRRWREADYSLPSSGEVKMVELYLHSFMGLQGIVLNEMSTWTILPF